jgi:hypothetical protein
MTVVARHFALMNASGLRNLVNLLCHLFRDLFGNLDLWHHQPELRERMRVICLKPLAGLFRSQSIWFTLPMLSTAIAMNWPHR